MKTFGATKICIDVASNLINDKHQISIQNECNFCHCMVYTKNPKGFSIEKNYLDTIFVISGPGVPKHTPSWTHMVLVYTCITYNSPDRKVIVKHSADKYLYF